MTKSTKAISPEFRKKTHFSSKFGAFIRFFGHHPNSVDGQKIVLGFGAGCKVILFWVVLRPRVASPPLC
ncbi:MAG: hypothetical protein C0469_08420 [Cyanobacteria bacterium DS2.3.42]|nr:hypothetical protein [Cyanobacteria bacterium DS2.3.42]